MTTFAIRQSRTVESVKGELDAEIAALRDQVEALHKKLSNANANYGHKNRAFHYASLHLDSVWRACDYASQALQGK